MRKIQIKDRNILNTCVRTFCSAGTKIPRHLLQKKVNITTMGTTMKITCGSPHSSNRIQPPRLDRGQGIQKTSQPQLGGEEASDRFKTHLQFTVPCNSQISHPPV